MACRHGDIDLCNEDKQKLATAFNLTVSILAQDNLIQGQLQNLKNHSPDAYTADNIDEICEAIDKLNDDIEPASRSLLAEIRNKQEELEEILKRAIEEDMMFHAEQEQLANLCRS